MLELKKVEIFDESVLKSPIGDISEIEYISSEDSLIQIDENHFVDKGGL